MAHLFFKYCRNSHTGYKKKGRGRVIRCNLASKVHNKHFYLLTQPHCAIEIQEQVH